MPDELKLPDTDDIRRLPRWARVAFAARCARRVLPLFRHHWPNAPTYYVRAVAEAVELAEQAAAARSDADFVADPRAAVALAVDARAARAAEAAAHAALAAAYDTDAATRAAAAARAAARAVASEHILVDFHTLVTRGQVENWTDDTPVPPEVFGPMWPDGVPPDWPTEAPTTAPAATQKPDDEFKLVIRAVAKPGVSAESVRHHVVELFKALNEYSLEKYGRRLTKDHFKRLVFETTGAGV